MPEESKYANFGEEGVIKKYIDQFGIRRGFAVDIGASNGRCSSNTLWLFENGWSGFCVEYDPQKFVFLADNYKELRDVMLCRVKITPDNVLKLLGFFCIKGIDFLNIDIDGYDFFVLDAILRQYRPSIISAEINQSIPPPIKFSVKYNPGYWWASDGFFGQSISQIELLCDAYRYQIACLEYNNVFLVPSEIAKESPVSAVNAYKGGFLNRSDSKTKLVSDWGMINALMALPSDKKIGHIEQVFSKYKGQFICSL